MRHSSALLSGGLRRSVVGFEVKESSLKSQDASCLWPLGNRGFVWFCGESDGASDVALDSGSAQLPCIPLLFLPRPHYYLQVSLCWLLLLTIYLL